jgi:hypothetical protein
MENYPFGRQIKNIHRRSDNFGFNNVSLVKLILVIKRVSYFFTNSFVLLFIFKNLTVSLDNKQAVQNY